LGRLKQPSFDRLSRWVASAWLGVSVRVNSVCPRLDRLSVYRLTINIWETSSLVS
jgi:hypothetical protein